MAHHVCGNAISVTTNTGKLVVVGPPVPQYKWNTATVSNMVMEDGVSPVTTIGDVVFRLNTAPVNIPKALRSYYSEGQLNDFRNVACTYGVWNGHACMSNAGQVSNGLHAVYNVTVPGYKTIFVAYRITGTPESSQPLFTVGNFKMKILADDNTKCGCDDISPALGIPLDTNGTISIIGIQFALVGSDTQVAYIGTNDTSVTRVQDSWFSDYTPAGPNDLIDFILGAPNPASASPAMEWHDLRYYAMNTMTDLEMIRIRDNMKAQYA